MTKANGRTSIADRAKVKEGEEALIVSKLLTMLSMQAAEEFSEDEMYPGVLVTYLRSSGKFLAQIMRYAKGQPPKPVYSSGEGGHATTVLALTELAEKVAEKQGMRVRIRAFLDAAKAERSGESSVPPMQDR